MENFDENNSCIFIGLDGDIITGDITEHTQEKNPTQYLPEDPFGYNKQKSSERVTTDLSKQLKENTEVAKYHFDQKPFKFKLRNYAENASLCYTNNDLTENSAKYDSYDYTKFINDDPPCSFEQEPLEIITEPEEYYAADKLMSFAEVSSENLENPTLEYVKVDTQEHLQIPAERNVHGNSTFVMDEYSKHLKVGLFEDDFTCIQNEFSEYFMQDSVETIEINGVNFEVDLRGCIRRDGVEYGEEITSTTYFQQQCPEYKSEKIQQEKINCVSEHNYNGIDQVMQKSELTECEITKTIDSEQILDWDTIGKFIYVEENEIEGADDIDDVELQASDGHQSDFLNYFISAEEDIEENITSCNYK